MAPSTQGLTFPFLLCLADDGAGDFRSGDEEFRGVSPPLRANPFCLSGIFSFIALLKEVGSAALLNSTLTLSGFGTPTCTYVCIKFF